MIDLGNIIDKLIRAGHAQRHTTGWKGRFSIRDHGHLLTPLELQLWLNTLHQACTYADKECTSDLHDWNFEEFQ